MKNETWQVQQSLLGKNNKRCPLNPARKKVNKPANEFFNGTPLDRFDIWRLLFT